jgi:hypothetical protein
MLQRNNDSLTKCQQATAEEAGLAALRLMGTLEDCLHPKAERLRARLARNPSGEELVLLRYDVLELLTLAFGRVEAMRRLQ